jgi:hypothetical protein
MYQVLHEKSFETLSFGANSQSTIIQKVNQQFTTAKPLQTGTYVGRYCIDVVYPKRLTFRKESYPWRRHQNAGPSNVPASHLRSSEGAT